MKFGCMRLFLMKTETKKHKIYGGKTKSFDGKKSVGLEFHWKKAEVYLNDCKLFFLNC